jgi:hypothetical protein
MINKKKIKNEKTRKKIKIKNEKMINKDQNLKRKND